MIPTIGIMIGLYIIARYFEMGKTAGTWGNILLGFFLLVTIGCVFGLVIHSSGN